MLNNASFLGAAYPLLVISRSYLQMVSNGGFIHSRGWLICGILALCPGDSVINDLSGQAGEAHSVCAGGPDESLKDQEGEIDRLIGTAAELQVKSTVIQTEAVLSNNA
jgi:hypothetical protein